MTDAVQNTPPADPSAAVAPEAQCLLRVLEGPSLQANAEILLAGARITIGSDPERASVVLANDIQVSRMHAYLQFEGDTYVVYDSESVSGTFVNEKPLQTGHPLVAGDRIRIGSTVLTFVRKRSWGTRVTNWKEMAPELILVAVVLAVVAGVVLAFPPQTETALPDLVTQAAKSVLPRKGKSVFVDWTERSFEEDTPVDKDLALLHYRRATRSFDNITLDPANAFSAILEMRRAKAYAWGETDALKQPFRADKADEVITNCQNHLRFQLKKYVAAYNQALGIGDVEQAAFCCRRVMTMFQDRFSEDKAVEYALFERRLRLLEGRVTLSEDLRSKLYYPSVAAADSGPS